MGIQPSKELDNTTSSEHMWTEHVWSLGAQELLPKTNCRCLHFLIWLASGLLPSYKETTDLIDTVSPTVVLTQHLLLIKIA